MERDGRLHSLRSRSPTQPPYHPPAISLAYDAVNAPGVTMEPYSCFSGLGGHVRHRGFRPMGPMRKRGAQSEKRPKSLGLSGGNAVNPAVTNCPSFYAQWDVYKRPR